MRKIFISVGGRFRPEQEAFLGALMAFLREHDLDPVVMNVTAFRSYGSPLEKVSDVMKECASTIVLGFERKRVETGTEKDGSDASEKIDGQKLTTVWNQIEAAIAYQLGHRVLVLFEDGICEEGILQFGYDWTVECLPLDPAALRSEKFLALFKDWKAGLGAPPGETSGGAAGTPKERRTLRDWIIDLETRHLVYIGGFFLAALSAAFSAGVKLAPIFGAP